MKNRTEDERRKIKEINFKGVCSDMDIHEQQIMD